MIWKTCLHTIFLYCIVVIVCVSDLFAAEKRPTVIYKLVDGASWNVCRDMVKNLEKLQLSAASFSCGLHFHPDMTKFSKPKWQELNIEDYWQEVYAIERQIQHRYSRVGSKQFAEWQEQYIQSLKNGYAWDNNNKERHVFRPRLYMTRVRLEQNGPLEIVLGYSLFSDFQTLCEEGEKTCPSPSWTYNKQYYPIFTEEKDINKYKECWRLFGKKNGFFSYQESGDYFVLYNAEIRRVVSLLININVDGPGIPSYLFFYNGRPYTVSISNDAYDIARIYKPNSGFLPGRYWHRSICSISRLQLTQHKPKR